MRIRTLHNIIIYFLTLTLLAGQFLPMLNSTAQTMAADTEEPNEAIIIDYSPLSNTNGFKPTQAGMQRDKKNAPPAGFEAMREIANESAEGESATSKAFDSLFNSNGPKIIFTPADAEEIRKLSCIASMIPDYETDMAALAEATGNSNTAFYKDLKTSDPARFQNIINDLKAKKEAAIPTDLKKPEYLSQLACVLGFDSVQAAEDFIRENSSAADSATYIDEPINAAVDTLKIDTRVLKMLNYLVTPKNRGGAGHSLIKVYRLRKGYTMPNRVYDRESEAIIQQRLNQQTQNVQGDVANQDQTVGQIQESASQQAATASGQVIDSTAPNSTSSSTSISDFAVGIDDTENQVISAHAEGEAVDISSVDSIKCTLIKKRRLGGDNKTPQPPKPIELQWQTEDGYSNSNEGRNDSVNSMVNGLYKNGILDLLDELDIDLNNTDDLSASNLGDILETVGQALIGQLINQNGNLSGADIAETLKKVGAFYLADRLKIPRASLYGSGYKNLDDIQVNLGRATLEQRLNLPFGSLAGNSATDIFYSTGERKMEGELELPVGTLTPDIATEQQLMIKIGASIIENKLHLNRGSFLKPSFEEIREAAGSKKFDIIFSMPQAVDTRLNLEGNDSASFRSKATSVNDYLTKIAFRHLSDRAYVYADFYSGSSVVESKRDAAFGTPPGSVDQLLLGNMSSLITIGQNEIAKKVTRRDIERDSLIAWFQTTNTDSSCTNPGTIGSTSVSLDEALIAATYGLQKGDFHSLFGCSAGGADAVFSQIGSQALLLAIKNSPDVVKAEKRFLAEHPDIVSVIGTIEFYVDHFKEIDKHLDSLDKAMNDLKGDPDGAEAYKMYQSLRDKIKGRKNTSVSALRDLASENKTNLGILRTRLSKSDTLRPKVNTVLYEIDQIFINIQEMIAGENGERLTDFKFSNLGIPNDQTNGSSKQATMSIQRAIWLLVTGKATVEDILVSIGGNKIENELNLPSNTFYYYVQSAKQAGKDVPKDAKKNGDYKPEDGKMEKDRFLASLGEAAVEEALSLPPDSFRGKGMPDPRLTETLADVVGHIASIDGMDASKAKNTLQNGFGSNVSLDLLMSGDTGAWSRARTAYLRLDQTLSQSPGTTQSFISGAPFNKDSRSYLTADEMDLLSAGLGIAKPALLKLTKVLAGQDSWQVNPVDFKDFNPYLSDTRTASVAGICQAQAENVYSYTDLDGDHTFATREQAINFFNAHRDRQLDYIGQIVKGLMAITGGTVIGEAIAKKTLTDFLKNSNQQKAFPDPIVLETVANRTGAPIETLSKLFTRPEGQSNLFKYLVNVGTKVGERRMSSALLGNIGFSIAGQRIGVTDIFDILNGGAPTTLYRIAGNFLDDRLGMNKGTFAQILSAPDSASRECLMQAAGASWLFKQLGITGMNLYGNPYAALGGSKIESALGWPNNSFKSDSPKAGEDKRAGLIALLNNVGTTNFVKGFKIPIAGMDFLSVAKSLFPDAKAGELDDLTNNQILDRLDYLESQSSLEDTRIYDARNAINKMITGRLSLIQNPDQGIIWKDASDKGQLSDFNYSGNKDPAVAVAASSVRLKDEVLAFRDRLNQLDSQVGHPTGDTKQLILGNMTPDAYRNYVSATQATIIAAMGLAKLLGVEEEKVKAAADIFTIFKEDGLSFQTWDSEKRAKFYKAFTDIFNLNLDEKAKFEQGTFQRIFTHPEQAKTILISQGFRRLDQSIFNPDHADKYSLQKIYDAREDGVSITDCNVAGGQLHGCHTAKAKSFGNDAMIAAGAEQLAAFVYTKSGDSLKLDAPEVQQFLSQFFRTGNVLVLEALANAELAKRINLFEDKKLTLPGGFQVVWGDIIGAIYGDRGMETYAADRAEAQYLAELKDPAFLTRMNTTRAAEPDSYTRDGGYGVSGQLNIGDEANPYSGITSQTDNPRDIAEQVRRNMDVAYEIPSGTDVAGLRTEFLTPPDPAAAKYQPIITETGPVLNNLYGADKEAYDGRKTEVERRRLEAKDHVQKSYQKNLQYHYTDSMLYKLDPNIPPGFAAAMFEGNSHTRANALLAWVKNGVLRGDFLGVSIGTTWTPALLYMIDRTRVGGEAAFANFVTSGEINKFDDVLRQKFDSVLGVSLAKGTFTSLIAGWKNGGNFKDDYSFVSGGKPIKMDSLQTVYKENFKARITGWVDRRLGLEPGTALRAYNGYKAYQAAKDGYALAALQYTAAAVETAHGIDNVLDLSNHLNDLRAAGASAAEIEQAEKALIAANVEAKNLQKVTAGAKDTMKAKEMLKIQFKAELVSFIISKVFAKQLGQLEEALGLVPGSGSMLVSMAVSWYYGLGIGPWAIGLFIVMNLFGYYKTEIRCTADGYYPKIGSPPSSSVADNGHLGEFDGMNMKTKQKEFIRAAQYKARTLLGDVLDMPAKFNDQRMTPSQIMTGRREDVDYWFPKTAQVIYKYTGLPDPITGELSSRAGLWQNPQTTAYTHIGF